jgi:hypothetical protein
VLEYEPLPEPEFLKLAAREGTRHEDWVVEDLQSDGWEVTDRQKEVRLSFPAFELVGHIDGIALRNGDRRLLEVKSMSRFRFASFASGGFSRFHDYAMQVTGYQKAVELPILYVAKDRDSGKRLDVQLDEPPLDWQDVYATILDVERHIRKRQLCPATRTDDFTCRICRYRYLCQEEAEQPMPVDKDVLEAAKLRRRAMDLEAEAKELRAEADPVLLAAAEKSGSFTVDDLSVVYVRGGESVSYPTAALKELVPADVLEQVKTVKQRAGYIKVEVPK